MVEISLKSTRNKYADRKSPASFQIHQMQVRQPELKLDIIIQGNPSFGFCQMFRYLTVYTTAEK